MLFISSLVVGLVRIRFRVRVRFRGWVSCRIAMLYSQFQTESFL